MNWRTDSNLFRRLWVLPLALVMIAPLAHAHKGKPHDSSKRESKQIEPGAERKLKAINESYVANVKPIFKKSCFDCHTSDTNFPWYSNFPGAKQLIQNDIAEAKEHLEMSGDFPFKGHGSPKEDLEAIMKAVDEESMPPFRYWIIHSGSRLSSAEKKAVRDWVNTSLKHLE